MSAQEAVELTAPGRREVTLAASELPVYVKSLPRLLAEILVVTVEQGTVPSSLALEGFYGPGMLRINGNNSVLNGGIKIERCGVYVNLANFDVRGAVAVGGGSYAAYSAFSPNVILDRIKIDGAQNSEDHSELIGVRGNGCGMITMSNFQVSNVRTVLLVTDASIAAVIDCSCSGNQTGAHVFKGGMILLAGSTPDTLGGVSNVNQGGLIVKSDGTLL